MNERIRAYIGGSRWVERMVDSFLTTIVIVAVGWVAGYVELKANVQEGLKKIDKLELKVDKFATEINSVREARSNGDLELKAEIAGFKAEHQDFRREMDRLQQYEQDELRKTRMNGNGHAR